METVPEDRATGGLKGGTKLRDVGGPSYLPPAWKAKLGESPPPGCLDPSWGLEGRAEVAALSIVRFLTVVASRGIRWTEELKPLLTTSKDFHAWRFTCEPSPAVDRICMLREPSRERTVCLFGHRCRYGLA